jgi:Fur family ferric uptake transcriptional regulator
LLENDCQLHYRQQERVRTMVDPAEKKFAQYLKKNNLKTTKQRLHVAGEFFSRREHISAEDLYTIVRKKFPNTGFTTVYRTLNLLVDAGLAASHNFKGSFTRFEPVTHQKHHDHLICLRCGKIIEFTNARIEKLQEEVAERHGFRVTDHTLEIFGICASCGKK